MNIDMDKLRPCFRYARLYSALFEYLANRCLRWRFARVNVPAWLEPPLRFQMVVKEYPRRTEDEGRGSKVKATGITGEGGIEHLQSREHQPDASLLGLRARLVSR